ncbi:hypothetical protein [Shimia sp. SDUM112013]|uniref:hypothetical protein n=1 Tax=Shimia sp. SDUM112013 TaxID=3136160 RepID=UPI0032EFD560
MTNIDFSQMITSQAKQETLCQMERDTKIREATAYLENTDWYVVRAAETGKPIPQSVLEKRAECRNEISG